MLINHTQEPLWCRSPLTRRSELAAPGRKRLALFARRGTDAHSSHIPHVRHKLDGSERLELFQQYDRGDWCWRWIGFFHSCRRRRRSVLGHLQSFVGCRELCHIRGRSGAIRSNRWRQYLLQRYVTFVGFSKCSGWAVICLHNGRVGRRIRFRNWNHQVLWR